MVSTRSGSSKAETRKRKANVNSTTDAAIIVPPNTIDEDAMSIDTTPAANGPTSTHKFSLYCMLRTEISRSKKGTTLMRSKLLETLRIIRDADDKACFTVYKTTATPDEAGDIVTPTSSLLRSDDDAPKSITALGRFFFRS